MKLNCSLCGTPYEFRYNKDQPLPSNFPFCSNRCKSIDLGKWLNEEYSIRSTIPESQKVAETDQDILFEYEEETLVKLFGDDSETD